MIIEILMPALSPTMTEGVLAKWFKKEGDKISPGEVIAEIETDKATMEVEAVDEGIIGKILVEAGTQNVLVGSAIALILEEESDKKSLGSYNIKGLQPTSIKPTEVKLEAKEEGVVVSRMQTGERIFASPLAKRLASDKGINLSLVEGSGPHGRIVKSDVLDYSLKTGVTKSEAKTAPSGGYTIEPHTNMRRVIARRLLESKQNVPHFYLNIECNLEKLIVLRHEVNASEGPRVSVNDFIIKAAAQALASVPEANSSWSDEGIIRYHDIDIAVAVAIEGGLVTPIIKSANFKSLTEISLEMKELAIRAKEGKLKPAEYQGGSFSISNLGMFGIKQFSAIINPPQSCILAVGAGIKTPIVQGENIKIATVAQLTLSCDHRVVDGAVGAKFLSSLKDFIEHPIKMLV